jgi:hypothetical protein
MYSPFMSFIANKDTIPFGGRSPADLHLGLWVSPFFTFHAPSPPEVLGGLV